MTTTKSSAKFSAKALGALFLVHFTGDFFQSFIHPLIPVIKARLGLSLTQVGIMASVVVVASFVTQPLMGLLADRYQPRRFMILGLMLSALFIPLMGIIPRFEWIVLIVGLGALGSSMYHPPTAGMVTNYSGTHASFGMAIFGLGGTLAFSIGPMAVTSFIVLIGLDRLPMASILGFTIILILYFIIPATGAPIKPKKHLFKGLRENLGGAGRAVMLIWLIASMRSLADVAIRTFYPVLYMEQSSSLISVGAILSLYTVGGALSALVCGIYADRKGYKPLYYFSFLLSTPCILLFLFSKGFWIYPAALLVGFVLLATMFPSVALATQLAPKNKSLVSSIVLGFAVGTGGIFAPLLGVISEHFGLLPVLTAIAIIPLLCLAIVPSLPDYPIPVRTVPRPKGPH